MQRLENQKFKNFIIFANSQTGKTTILEKLSELLDENEIPHTGFITREISRKGFRCVPLGKAAAKLKPFVLAHLNFSNSPHKVSKYGVDVDALDKNCDTLFCAKLEEGSKKEKQVVIIDEIGRMETTSKKFNELVQKSLDDPNTVLVASVSQSRFLQDFQSRKDTKVLEIDPKLIIREDIPGLLVDRILQQFPEEEEEGRESKTKQEKTNKGVVCSPDGKIEVRDVGYPTFKSPVDGSEVKDGVILKIITSAICGSDRHMQHGRTAEKKSLVLGHEITGEVIEKGPGVNFLNEGDIVCVPFNVACGHCVNCRQLKTSICTNVNNELDCGIYGYAMSGGWKGGQAEYVMVPFADFNCIKLPDHFKNKIWKKMLDLALVTDVLPTAYSGALNAGVGLGKSVFIAGAGPIGLSCAYISCLLGASQIFISDTTAERLERAKKHIPCQVHVFDITKNDEKQIIHAVQNVLGTPNVDCAVDCVGYEAKKIGADGKEQNPGSVLNFLGNIVKAGGLISVPGVYLSPDPKGVDQDAQQGILPIAFSQSWIKGINIVGVGQTPVLKYANDLVNAILHDKLSVAKLLNVQVITLDEVPKAFHEFDKGKSVKYIIDPHGRLREKLEEICNSCGQKNCSSSDCKDKNLKNISSNCSNCGQKDCSIECRSGSSNLYPKKS